MRQQLLTEIQSELVNLAANAPALVANATVPKIYEIYVLMCLARALRSIGATLQARDSSDTPTNNLVFRLGPGLLYSPASAPGFILVSYKGREYEIQNSLQVLGRSRVMHELDICLIDRTTAEYCRQYQVNPLHTKISFVAECKYYGATLDLSLGREYLGLSSEFSLRVKTMVSNVGSDDIHDLITGHRGTENFNVSPDDPDNVDIFIKWLANELRQVL